MSYNYPKLIEKYSNQINDNPNDVRAYIHLNAITLNLILEGKIPLRDSFYTGEYENSVHYYGRSKNPNYLFQGVGLPKDFTWLFYHLESHFFENDTSLILYNPKIKMYTTSDLHFNNSIIIHENTFHRKITVLKQAINPN